MESVLILGLIRRGFKKSSIFLLCLVSFLNVALAQDLPEGWTEKKSRHFIINYDSGVDPIYAKRISYKAESYYKTIINNLGFRRFDFWTWEKRCKIFLYSSQKEYYNDNERPEWSAGEVNIRQRTISSYIQGEDFLDSVLPHEMGHLIFREFVGQKRWIPLWLDEGVACFSEAKSRPERFRIARSLVRADMYIPLEDLTRINSPDSIILPVIFYSQAASLVDFLLTNYGKDDFLDFSRKVRDGENWREALRSVYDFKTVAKMEEAWVEYLSDEGKDNN